MLGNSLIARRGGVRFVAMKRLNRVIALALEKTAVSERRLSEEAGYHPTSFPRYKVGARNATPAAARALAEVLRRRAALLLKLVGELNRAADKEEG